MGDFPAGPCLLGINCKAPTHQLKKHCSKANEATAADTKVTSTEENPVSDASDNSAALTATTTTLQQQPPFFQYLKATMPPYFNLRWC